MPFITNGQQSFVSAHYIDSCFKELENKSIFENGIITDKYYPFFEPCPLSNALNFEKLASGSKCVQYGYSAKMELMRAIFKSTQIASFRHLFNLIDTNKRTKIYDIKKYNCSGMKKKIGQIDTINQDVVVTLLKSYRKWYEMCKEKGYGYMMEHELYPTSFCKYKWQREIGFTTGVCNNDSTLKIASQMLADTDYLSYFIKQQRITSDKSNRELISELTLLTLINCDKKFTDDVLKFKIVSRASSEKNFCYSAVLKLLKCNKGNVKDIWSFLKDEELTVELQ